MSEPNTGLSKRFAIEIPTGETKTVSIKNSRGRVIGERQEPITQRFPPDRRKSLRTKTTYTKDDSTGRLTNPNVKVYQEITEEQWKKLPDNVKDIQTGVGARGARPGRTIYYGEIAEIPAGQRNYIPSKTDDDTFVIDELYESDRENAKLLREEIGKYPSEGQFKTVSRVANESVLKNEGINPNKSNSKNQLGLGKDGPTDIVDEENSNLQPLPKFGNFDPIEQFNSRSGYGTIRYPSDLRAELQDVIKFTQLVYGARTFSKSTDRIVTGFGKRDLGTPRGTVTLPIQNRITDSNLVNWGEGRMNPFQALTASKMVGMDFSNIGGAVNDMLDTTKNLVAGGKDSISGELATALQAFFIERATQSQDVLTRATGAILNPNVELLFRSPQLRPFNFSFFLTARDDKDAKAIKQIIRFFKQGMSVKNTKTDIFLKAPNVFKIEYLHENGRHNGLNLIKECALTNCSVEYTPANTFSTFEDGTMTAYRISLVFSELTPVTEEDYKDKNGNDLPDSVIGY